MSSEPVILVDKPYDGVVRITLNRPKALNALNVDLLYGLAAALRAAQADRATRVILLEGAGERSFCAGEDLKQTLAPRTGGAEELRASFEQLQDLTRYTSSARCVVVAAVQGFAVGGGAEVALGADFVVGGPGCRFRFPEVPIGHAATGGITLRLSHMVGLLKAKELLLTGRWVDAEEAARIGLLSELVDGDPKARALELAKELAALPGVALTSSKTSLESALFRDMEGCLHDEVNVASYCFSQSDASKAFTDFAARKLPAGAKEGHSSQGLTSEQVRDINSAFARAVRNFPARVFLRILGTDYTFSEADAIVARYAGGLRQADIGPGDRVLGMMVNSAENVFSWLATNRLGAVWVPVNTELKSVTLQHVIQAAQPKLAIVDQALWPELRKLEVLDPAAVYIHGEPAASGETKALSDLAASQLTVTEPVIVDPSTTAAFLYTSGTAGKSKPCVLSHEYFTLQAQALVDECAINQNDVLYCPFPLFHADATALTVIPAILTGAVAALSVRFSASGFWDEIRSTKATVYDFMGATLALVYKQPPSGRDREHSVRLAWGVPVPAFAEEYEDRFGHPLVTLYGSVESSLPIFQDRSGGPLPRGSCGRLRPGFQARIADDSGEEVPAGSTGNLLLRSDRPNAFFKGYFNDAASTAAAFAGLWLNTGDLARIDGEGHVYFAGRVKDVIRRRGENVNAAEVEEEFLRHPEVLVAAAYAVPSRLGAGTEEDVKVAVQLRAGSAATEPELWEWANGHMARFQVPSVLEVVDEIKKTPTGKVEKGQLRAEGGHVFEPRSLRK